jgi:hypothetical protein
MTTDIEQELINKYMNQLEKEHFEELEKFINEKLVDRYKTHDFYSSIIKVQGSPTINIHINEKSRRKIPYNFVLGFYLSEMHGCCGIVVSHNLNINEKFKSSVYQFGNFFQELRTELCKKLGYSQIICTTITNNIVENHLLVKYGWKFHEDSKFVNKRTNNEIVMWTKGI